MGHPLPPMAMRISPPPMAMRHPVPSNGNGAPSPTNGNEDLSPTNSNEDTLPPPIEYCNAIRILYCYYMDIISILY